MTPFQQATLAALALIVALTLVATARRRLSRPVGFAWVLLWLAAALVVAFPDLSSRVAHWTGVGRGADLIDYLSTLVVFFALFMIYMRFRRIDEQLTTIVRHLAIRNAEDELTRKRDP
jgi:hypothetical protein